MSSRNIQGYTSKLAIVEKFAVGKNVLHLGAVGETCQDTELRVERAGSSLHAHLTKISKQCVGVDNDEASVKALVGRGVFDNLFLTDVVHLRREDIPLEAIDLIVAGDTIEHLSEPGRLLEVAENVSDRDTRLLITTPNSLGFGLFIANLRGQVLEGPDHACSFNAFTLANLVERYGWRIDEMWTCYQPTAAQRVGWIFGVGRAVMERLPRLGGTLVVVCSRVESC